MTRNIYETLCLGHRHFDVNAVSSREGPSKYYQSVSGRHLCSSVPVISIEEQLTGWYSQIRRAKDDQMLADAYERLAETVALYNEFRVVAFPVPVIQRYRDLQSLKLGVKKMDLRIAAITLEHSGILVTRNLRDFKRVPGLLTEDWSV